jgi:hypothetical protein
VKQKRKGKFKGEKKENSDFFYQLLPKKNCPLNATSHAP